MIWRLNEGRGGLGVAHRLPLAHHCARSKCELTGELSGDEERTRSGQNGAGNYISMTQLFLHSVEGAAVALTPL